MKRGRLGISFRRRAVEQIEVAGRMVLVTLAQHVDGAPLAQCYVRRYSGLADAGCPEDFSSRLEIEA